MNQLIPMLIVLLSIVLILIAILGRLPFTINKKYPHEKTYKYIPAIVCFIAGFYSIFWLVYKGDTLGFFGMIPLLVVTAAAVLGFIINMIAAIIIDKKERKSAVDREESAEDEKKS